MILGASTRPGSRQGRSPTTHSLLSVARHKAMFFTENDARGVRIDYEAAVSGHLQLVPEGAGLAILSDDYSRMLADGMLLDDNDSFDMLMERCALLEARANETKV